jgi:hypothetical protein
MRTGVNRSLAALAVALVLIASLGVSSDAAPRRAGRSCEQPRGFGAWLYYTQAQTFAALDTDPRRVEIRLVFLRSFTGKVDARLVWHPAQQSDGQLVGGEIVREGTATVRGLAGDVRWVTAELAAPALPAPARPAGVWALYVDLPVDPSHQDGPLAWAGCTWGPSTGSAYEVTSPDVIDRAALGIGLGSVAPGLARQPLVADPHPRIAAFQYRVWTE